MVDDKLQADEARRQAEYDAVRAEAGAEVRAEARAAMADRAETQDVARSIQDNAASEIAQTEREVQRGRAAARISQVIDYIFFLIYGLLGIRLLLALFAAREGNDFVQFIRTVTDPIYAPFKGIVASPTAEGHTLALPIVVAIVVYALVHLAINGLLRILAHRKVEI